ncbi:putative ABC transport system permease protein [Anaerosolibacter carboniphilus]|uniref:Putative ABC transport system permease protein n=1 Tax=Anaerosolibacter carboniphilus TaxID=1417629 RepID=A0A841KP60_9FIRM|nr:ABC transporter permease [Anaerosolibacter carboniphilus]MBB6215227.1 putative ABC transport system permease protein [Anaerosolibacter carboniphilus]
MSLIEILRSIFINIRGNKAKVFLTTLGIIVGTLTVVLVLSIGKGSQASVEEQFKSLNVGTIQIMAGFGRNTTVKLSADEMIAIQEEAPSIKKVSMVINDRGTISYYSTSTTASVAGVTEELKEINNLAMAYGNFINEEHNEDTEKVAVIGHDIAELFFEEDISEAVGEKITINGKRYEVIGVLKQMGDSSMRGFNPDEGIFIPYSVAEKYITGRMARPTILALAQDIDHVSSAIEEINSILQSKFRDKSDQFMIVDAGSRLQSAKDSAKTMTLMLLSVATVVLMVGGIGIMNVLFVSVKERTKEIGILKAIGARRKDILLIFLLEAIIVSAAGGIIGILGSMLVMPALNYFQVRAIPSFDSYLLAFGFSVGIGTFFGYYPAAKAAALKPIEALNYE